MTNGACDKEDGVKSWSILAKLVFSALGPIPMFIVACRLMISWDRGVRLDTFWWENIQRYHLHHDPEGP